MKYFSLTSFNRTNYYEDLIVPLLCRMINLEELKLYLSVIRCDSTYIDGIQLYDQFLIYMTQLKKFTFNIHSSTRFYNKFNLPSNEYIQETFKDFQNKQIISSIDYQVHIFFPITKQNISFK